MEYSQLFEDHPLKFRRKYILYPVTQYFLFQDDFQEHLNSVRYVEI